ncbi:MAG: IPT/TIG domain-containing protein, partial [Candidatus Sericytochromatia bacterium]|nr:IPT/TIG domain-containing protein [Candidatus Tanganyikabacteria bacterium]
LWPERPERAERSERADYPASPRKTQSLAPSTDRIKFEVRGPAPAELNIPDLVRPNGGSLAQTVSVSLPVRTGIEMRATGFAGTAVVGQSLWTGLPLRPNARIDVPLELLPASGPDLLRAVLLAPRIDSVAPERGYTTSTTVTIRGANFGYSRGLGGVSFGGVDAGEATLWTENSVGATISAKLPPGARTGPVQVRVGRADSPQRIDWPAPGSGGSGDPWKGRFTVLGPAGEPFGIDSGKILDFKTAFDGTQRNFWLVWTREGGQGIQLMASAFSAGAQPISTLTQQGSVKVTESAGLQLGGIATDATGIWVTWQETTPIGSRVMFGHLAANATLTDRVGALSTTPANPASPVIVRSPKDDQMLAAWIDNRDSEGIYERPRIYTQILSPAGQCGSIAFDPDRGFYVTSYGAQCPGTVNPAQESNKKGVISNLSRVGGLSAASNGSTFLVGWHETVTDTFSLRFQRFGSKGVRHFSEIAGTREAGPSDTEFLNPSLPGSRRSLEEPQLLWNDTEKEYLVAYISRIGSKIGRSSDVYVHRLDDFGKEVSGNQPQVISDDTRGN